MVSQVIVSASSLPSRCCAGRQVQRQEQISLSVAPRLNFLLRAECIDVITAAGSLNYADLDLFFKEAARILVPSGIVVIYDFSPGRAFLDSDALDQWFRRFVARFPWPPDDAADLNRELLSTIDHGFQLHDYEHFEIGITLTRAFYLENT